MLGQRDLATFTVDSIIETLRHDGYRDTLEEKVQEALDNYFDTRHGTAEGNQDYIHDDMMSRSLQNSTKIERDEKMRGYWLIGTSALSEQHIAGIRITARSTDCLL